MSALGIVLALAASSGQDVTLDTEAGYSGTVFRDGWNPMTAVVRNEGGPFTGELRLVIHTVSEEPLVFRRPVTLSEGARARYSEDVFLGGFESRVEFVLEDPRGRVRRRNAIPLSFASDVEFQVLVVGPPPRWLWKAGQGLAAAPQAAPELMPRDVRPLLAADVLVFPEPVPLEPDQQGTIRRWTELGGRLVFAAGRSTLLRQDGFWRALCPLTSPEPKAVPVRAGQADVPITLVSGSLRQGKAFLTLGGQPAGFRTPLGLGEVVFLAFPLDQEALEDAVPAVSIWPQILDLPPPREEVPGRQSRDRELALADTDEFLGRLLRPEAPLNLAALGLGSLGLAAYVVFIGPVDYRRLKKSGRLKRGWVSFTVAAALCGAFSLTWGGVLSPRVSPLDHLIFADESMVQTFSALRSSDGRVHEFRADGAVWPVPIFRTFGSADERNPSTVRPGGRMRLAVPALAARTFVTCRTPASGEGEVTCRWTNRPAARFEVENGSALRLRECLAVTRDRVWSLGEVAPASRKEFALANLEAISFAAWAETFWSSTPVEQSWFHPNVWDAVRRERHGLFVTFYRAIRETWRDGGLHRLRGRRLDLSGALERGGVVFVGAFSEDASGVRVDSQPDTVTRGLVRRVVRDGGR